jgi:Ubiquitin carboxyl-terminal hydrolase
VWVKKGPAAPQPLSEENLPPNVAEPPAEFVFQKNKAAVSIPESLTLDPFCTEGRDIPPHSSSQYKLKSIVHHIGQRPFSGHYIAHAIRPRKDDRAENGQLPPSTGETVSLLSVSKPVEALMETPGPSTTAPTEPVARKSPLDPYQWVAFDDTYSALVDLEEILKSPSRQSTAYMLLYALEDEGASIVEGVELSSA